MKKYIATSLIVAMALLSLNAQADRYVGGDISLLPEYEAAGSKYKDHSGKSIPDFLPWCREQGMNAMRVRLFVDPSKYTGSDADPNTCQTLEYILPLCQQIKENGFALMLDFHYSDTWADPAKQYTPADWKDLTDEELYEKIYEYTKESLLTLKEAGAAPDFIQPGNEISYGMLWGPQGTPAADQKKTLMGSSANWDRFGKLLNQAIKACHEVCPDAKIVLHTERVAQVNVLKNFYDKMKSLKVDYDIIGLSYYPYFHGGLDVLETALTTLEGRYPDKNIMIVETGYPYKWEVPGTTHNLTDEYPYSDAGQNKFATDLVDTLEKHSAVDGLFWWWMEYNAYGTSLSGWYNAPLFNSETGKATSAFKTICSFAESSGIDTFMPDTESGIVGYYGLDGVYLGSNPENLGKGVFICKTGSRAEKVLK